MAEYKNQPRDPIEYTLEYQIYVQQRKRRIRFFCLKILLFLLFFIPFIIIIKFYYVMHKVELNILNRKYIQAHQHIQKLHNDIPITQLFNLQKKIQILMNLGQWQKTLNATIDATNGYYYRRSFVIWYYKALCEYRLSKLRQAELSAIYSNYLYNTNEAQNLLNLIGQHSKSKERMYMFGNQQSEKSNEFEDNRRKLMQMLQL